MLCFTAYAQEEDEPIGSMTEAWTFHVYPDKVSEFEAALKEHIAFRKNKEDPADWDLYTPYASSKLGTYSVRRCCFDWANVDSYLEWGAQSGVGEHWASTAGQYVKRTEHHYQEIDFENSNWQTDTEKRFFVVTSHSPKAGTGQEFKALIKEMSTHAKNGNWPREWLWVSSATGPYQVDLVSGLGTMAEMTVDMSFLDLLTKEMKSEKKANALLKRYSELGGESTRTIHIIRPDLL